MVIHCVYLCLLLVESWQWLLVGTRSNRDSDSLKYCDETMTKNLVLMNWQNGSISWEEFPVERSQRNVNCVVMVRSGSNLLKQRFQMLKIVFK